jgi:hypothetical protein
MGDQGIRIQFLVVAGILVCAMVTEPDKMDGVYTDEKCTYHFTWKT